MPRMKRINKVVTVCVGDKAEIPAKLSDKEVVKATAARLAEEVFDKMKIGETTYKEPEFVGEIPPRVDLPITPKTEPVLTAKQFQESLNKVVVADQVFSVTTKETKMTKRTRKTKTTVKPDFYARYHHVVPGSVREPGKVDLRSVTNCHGRVCDVRCVDCKRVFVINTQDAFQCLRCDECKAKRSKERRNERNSKKRSKRSR